MPVHSWRSPLRAHTALGASCLLLLAPRSSLAQTTAAPAQHHHVDGLLGLVFAAPLLTEESDVDAATCSVTGCPPQPPRTNLPPAGPAWSARLGYRFRPLPFFELGLSPEASFHTYAQNYALPLMAYARFPLRDGTGLTVGVGGGIAVARGTNDGQQTDPFLRIELGGVVPLGGAWSLALAVQGSVSAKAAFSSAATVDAFDEHPEWVGFSLGPRYSF